ncbi:type II toxin-antitoxin system RelE/ParE family toxin [soil metagenome]
MKFSFVERPQFTKRIIKLLPEDEYFSLQDYLLEHPNDGDVIPRLPFSIRKIRWRTKYGGKRGGIRIVYYLVLTQDVIIFLDVWAKNEKEDLTRAEYKILCDYLEELGL